MPAPDVLAFVRGALPEPPARVLEIGAGDGSLAAALREGGYDVVAIDPAAAAPGVDPVALHELEARAQSFDAALAVVSLHHVQPLARSCRRLSELLRPGARLVVDELDVARLDERATAWWQAQRRAAGADPHGHDPAGIVAEMREHLHPLARIREALAPWFDLGEPVPGPYLYRWHLDPALRPVEERLIAAGALPAIGVRLVGVRRE
jgi:SAM-dependent methyltransferase